MAVDNFVAKNWSSMIRPVTLENDGDAVKANYGKFVAKPLERGYGQTLGNSLRRVLLSSLQGAGIVAIRLAAGARRRAIWRCAMCATMR